LIHCVRLVDSGLLLAAAVLLAALLGCCSKLLAAAAEQHNPHQPNTLNIDYWTVHVETRIYLNKLASF